LFMKQFLTRYGKHVKPPSKVSTHPLDILTLYPLLGTGST
jgi:hypothetical protein